jgi:hypothetical protein
LNLWEVRVFLELESLNLREVRVFPVLESQGGKSIPGA